MIDDTAPEDGNERDASTSNRSVRDVVTALESPEGRAALAAQRAAEREQAERQEREAQEADYEERVVLFLDILGFSDVVERSVHDRTIIGDVLRAVRYARELADSDGASDSERLTQFSDSLVLSIRADETSGAFWQLDAVAMVVAGLVEHGFLVRGGVTVGLLRHTDDFIMGPAMNEAYRLESKVAKTPRVIVDEKVLLAARAAPSPGHEHDREEEYARAFLERDDDGLLFVDYVSYKGIVEGIGIPPDGYIRYLRRLTDICARGLDRPAGHIRDKYVWLHDKISDELGHIRLIGGMPGRRHGDPDFWNDIDMIAADYRRRTQHDATEAEVTTNARADDATIVERSPYGFPGGETDTDEGRALFTDVMKELGTDGLSEEALRLLADRHRNGV